MWPGCKALGDRGLPFGLLEIYEVIWNPSVVKRDTLESGLSGKPTN